jgi:hypothetical protein
MSLHGELLAPESDASDASDIDHDFEVIEPEQKQKEYITLLEKENADLKKEKKDSTAAFKLLQQQKESSEKREQEFKAQSEVMRKQLVQLRKGMFNAGEEFADCKDEPVSDQYFHSTVMMCTAEAKKDFKPVEILFFQGANINAQFVLFCLLHDDKINFNMVKWLINHGYDQNQRTEKTEEYQIGRKKYALMKGSTALMRIAMLPIKDEVQDVANSMLAWGAKLDGKNSLEDTALHMAAYCNQPASVRFLVEAKASTTFKNKSLQTPWDAAYLRHKDDVHPEIRQLLAPK